jgi:hypothetical protein
LHTAPVPASSDHGTNWAKWCCTTARHPIAGFIEPGRQRPEIDRPPLPGGAKMHAPVSKRTKRSAERLFVLCPTTKSPIVTNIRTDVRSLAKAWHLKIQVPCPHCNEIHKYKVSAAFAEAAISDEHIRGGFLASGLKAAQRLGSSRNPNGPT